MDVDSSIPNTMIDIRSKPSYAITIGADYVTRGGWMAVLVWFGKENGLATRYYFVHKPGTNDESEPVMHRLFAGVADDALIACATFLVNAPPVYGVHPADVMGLWENQQTVPEPKRKA